MAISARWWKSACKAGLGKAYGHSGTDTTDCVRFAVDVLLNAGIGLSPADKQDILISHGDRSRPFSGPEVFFRRGYMALTLGLPPMDGAYIVQGWRRLDDGMIPNPDPGINGHCFLIFVDDGVPYLLEATSSTHIWCRVVDLKAQLSAYKAGWKGVYLP